jgi:aryl-alcohol dehydrogenase-like predicted oxidoreductase
VPIEETVGAMTELVRAGKVRHLGLCEVTRAQLTAVDTAGAAVAGNLANDLTSVSAGRE